MWSSFKDVIYLKTVLRRDETVISFPTLSAEGRLDWTRRITYADMINAVRRGEVDVPTKKTCTHVNTWIFTLLNRRALLLHSDDDQLVGLQQLYSTFVVDFLCNPPPQFACLRRPSGTDLPRDVVFAAGYRSTTAALTFNTIEHRYAPHGQLHFIWARLCHMVGEHRHRIPLDGTSDESMLNAVYEGLFEAEQRDKNNHTPSALLALCVGMPVVLLHNLCTQYGLSHGTTAVVYGFAYNGATESPVQPIQPNALKSDVCKATPMQPVLLLRLDHPHDDLPSALPRAHPSDPPIIAVSPVECTVRVNLPNGVHHNVVFTQLPVRPAVGNTVHSMEGMTLNNVCVMTDELFQTCMPLVAISRVRGLQHLYLRTPFTAKTIAPGKLGLLQELVAVDDDLRVKGAATLARMHEAGMLSPERIAAATGRGGQQSAVGRVPFYDFERDL